MTLALKDAVVRRGGRALLDAVSFTAEPGAFTAICGPNGAGKSTALNLISGAMKPDSGAVLIDQEPLDAIPARTLALRRAVLPQTPSLGFPFLVHEVVAMGRAPHHGRATLSEDAEAVEGAMDLVRISDMAERNYLTLSGGERQRVQIARVIAQLWHAPQDGRNRWLLLDEPTAALDLKHQLRLMHLLARLAGECWGVLAVLHDLPLVKRWADKVVLVSGGRIVGDGAPCDVLTESAVADAFDLDHPFSFAA
ncbi:MAG: heme ABC transporter ATP-binding protein [Oceanicaulis sp.]